MHNNATHIVNYIRQKKESLQQQLEDVRCGKEVSPYHEQTLQFAVVELQDILHHITPQVLTLPVKLFNQP